MANIEPTFESLDSEPKSPSNCLGCGDCGTRPVIDRAGGTRGSQQSATAVRFGYMHHIGRFNRPADLRFTPGAKLIIQTRRGLEIGEHVVLTCDGCNRSLPTDRVREWCRTCGEGSFIFDAGRILREATAADLAEYARIQSFVPEKIAFCQKEADRLRLPLKIVECECPFGGERIIFYFTAESRVDFRDMVKELAREFRTRIELRQVGARDEARLLADYETCGMEVCCKVFLKNLKPISMKMAKMQKATLDPSKVSGRCGRLKCCLKYEHASYEELNAKLPRLNVEVQTAHGLGVVVARHILTQLLQVRVEDGTVHAVSVDDLGAPTIEPERKVAPSTTGRRDKAAGPEEKGRRRRRPARRPGDRKPAPKAEQAPTKDSQTGTPNSSKPQARDDEGKRTAETDAQQQGSKPRQDRRRPRRRKRRGPNSGPAGPTTGGTPPTS